MKKLELNKVYKVDDIIGIVEIKGEVKRFCSTTKIELSYQGISKVKFIEHMTDAGLMISYEGVNEDLPDGYPCMECGWIVRYGETKKYHCKNFDIPRVEGNKCISEYE